MKIDLTQIRDLAEILRDTDLAEIEIEEGGKRVRLVGQPTNPVVLQQQDKGGEEPVLSTPRSVSDPLSVAVPPSATASSPAAVSPPIDLMASHPGLVKSPMVGTVFLAPEPGAKPYIAEGDSVTVGDTLVTIETMKVMNPIHSPYSGIVRKIAVENGEGVEFGQALAIIEN